MRSELSKNRATNKAMLIKGVMASAVRFPLSSSPVIRETSVLVTQGNQAF